MFLSKILSESREAPLYKVSIKYKGKEIDFYLTREELLKGILGSTNSKNTIQFLMALVKNKFKEPKVENKDFFLKLNSFNIINEKTQTSFQINRIQNLDSSEKSDYQIIVGSKQGLTGNTMDDITDKNNTDKTKNGIFDIRLQNALMSFKQKIEQDK